MESSSGVRVSEQKLPERAQFGIFSSARSLQTANESLRSASVSPCVFIRAPVINCPCPRKTILLICACAPQATPTPLQLLEFNSELLNFSPDFSFPRPRNNQSVPLGEPLIHEFHEFWVFTHSFHPFVVIFRVLILV